MTENECQNQVTVIWSRYVKIKLHQHLATNLYWNIFIRFEC